LGVGSVVSIMFGITSVRYCHRPIAHCVDEPSACSMHRYNVAVVADGTEGNSGLTGLQCVRLVV
jgi:hypothetical protein